MPKHTAVLQMQSCHASFYMPTHSTPVNLVVATEGVLNVAWSILLVRVVLIVVVAVVLVVELLRAASSLALRLLAVNEVLALCLGEPVDLSTCEAS